MTLVTLLVLAIAFTLVLMVSYHALGNVEVFRPGRLVLSVCTALLAVLGMVWTPPSPNGSAAPADLPADDHSLSFVALPYAALGITLLLLPLLALLRRLPLWRSRDHRCHERRDDRTPGRSSTPGRQARHRKVSGRESERG